jgi:hypothetical protein
MSIGAFARPVLAQACRTVAGFSLGLTFPSAAADPLCAPWAVAVTTGPARVSDIENLLSP